MNLPTGALAKFIRACLIIVMGSLSLYGVGVFAEASHKVTKPLFGESRVSLRSVLSDQNPLEGSNALPEEFEAEIFSVAGFYEVSCANEGAVVGLLAHDSAEEMFAFCRAELERGGWTKIESGYSNSATFIKPEGRFTWLFVSCTEVCGDASVLVHYA